MGDRLDEPILVARLFTFFTLTFSRQIKYDDDDDDDDDVFSV